MDLSKAELTPDVSRLIPHNLAARLCAVPIDRSDMAISVAMANPLDIMAIDELQAHTGLEIDPVIATEEDIREAIFRTFGAYDDLGEIVGAAIKGIDPARDPTGGGGGRGGPVAEPAQGDERGSARRPAGQRHHHPRHRHPRQRHPRRAGALAASACGFAWTACCKKR